MLRFVVCCALMAMVAADECGHMQIIRVKSQWAEAFGVGNQRNEFGQAIWRALFAHTPDARDLFDRVNGNDVNSPEFKAHSQRVLSGLDMTISLMDDEEAFTAQLAHLQGQHEARNIPGQYFQVFEDALVEVVHASVGRCFEADAWRACFQRISSGIKQ